MASEVFVSGGTGLIGSEIVDQLMRDGFDVITTTTTKKKAGDFVKHSRKLRVERIDFTNSDFADRLENIFSNNKALVAIINNARSLKFFETNDQGLCQPDDLISEFNLDVVIPYKISLMAVELVPNLETIINISSQYASRVPNPNLYNSNSEMSPIQYNVSKAALNKITKELAVRLGERKIRVNCIEFGGVEGRAPNAFINRYNAKAPHSRMLKASECYGPIKMLLDKNNSAINGAVIEANAGWTLC